MHKIADKVRALPPGDTFHSLEFFPPKTDAGFHNLVARLERMSQALRPLFVTVTWGAGGSTASKSLHLAELCQKELELTTCLHLTCTNMSRETLDDALEGAKATGIRNILALRGDPPRNEEYMATPGDNNGKDFEYAIDLVRYIREKYGDYFCIGVAAYPEGHAEGTAPEVQDPKHDLPYLIEKVKAGADFIMTQLFYDAQKYVDFVQMLRNDPSGVFKDIIIIPGLMPIQSYQLLRRTTKLSHASLPQSVEQRLMAVKNDDDKVKTLGVDVLCEIIDTIRSHPTGSSSRLPQGFHFYTLNLEKAVSFVVEKSKLLKPITATLEDESAISEDVEDLNTIIVGGQPRNRRLSSIVRDPRDHVIVDAPEKAASTIHPLLENPQEAGYLQIQDPQNQLPGVNLAISEGEGIMGREATWDDFPNGRFGDARSPAFGEIDGYGPSLHLSRTEAVKLWGYPVTADDISNIFVRHIQGEISAIPWSEEDLRDESNVIQGELVRLNKRGLWTVASQPAVNGARSDDATFGWGPKGGFVFQKAFVEFFISPENWERLEKRLKELGDVISYYAATSGEGKKGNYSSNMPSNDEALNAVTWGCFRGKEITTPTIIEEANFRAWKEEAFTIWNEWSSVYPRKSATRDLLKKVTDTYWLVNVVHHEYMEPNALWELLDGSW